MGFSAVFWVIIALGALGLAFKKYSKGGKLKAPVSAKQDKKSKNGYIGFT